MKLKEGASSCSVSKLEAGDYVKVAGGWKCVESISVSKEIKVKDWRFKTDDGGVYGIDDIHAYAKSEDLTS